MIKKVVITGGSGFLGSMLAIEGLKRGWQVFAIARHPDPVLISTGVKFVLADISRRDSLELLESAFAGADVVFHTAAKADIWGHWKEFRATNIYGTNNVLAAAKAAGVKNLVFTSSPSVVYTGDDIVNGTEKLPYCKIWKESYYAFTKAKSEQAVLEADCDTFHTAALRPHLIWGVGDTHLVPTLLKSASLGRLRIVGDGGNVVSLTHIKNAVHAHLKLAEALESGNTAVRGNAYFITDRVNVVLWPWINRILKGIGMPALKREDAKPLAAACREALFLETFWHIFSVEGHPPMTRFAAKNLARTHTFSTAAAEQDFGYKSIINPEEELQELIESLKA